MKCAIIQDLIPLYIDQSVSNDSQQAILEHIRSCKACKNVLKNQSENICFEIKEYEEKNKREAQLIKRIRKKIAFSIAIGTVVLFWLIFFIFMFSPAKNPIWKDLFYYETSIWLQEDDVTKMYGELIDCVENKFATKDLRIMNLQGEFSTDGEILNNTTTLCFTLQDDDDGFVRVYECYYDQSNEILSIYTRYILCVKREGISSKEWENLSAFIDFSLYDFTGADYVNLRMRENEIQLRGYMYDEQIENGAVGITEVYKIGGKR